MSSQIAAAVKEARADAPTDPLVLAGRAFAQHYQSRLDAGTRGQLRRAEPPSIHQSFWSCMQAAERVMPQGRDGRVIELCEQIISSRLLDSARQADSCENVGAFLKRHSAVITMRRIESVLASTNRGEVIEGLGRIVAIIGNPRVDFGLLLGDLYYFGDRVRRRWAMSCFG